MTWVFLDLTHFNSLQAQVQPGSLTIYILNVHSHYRDVQEMQKHRGQILS